MLISISPIAGVFTWNGDAIDIEDKYNRDMKILERKTTAGFKRWKDYVNDSKYLFLAIQGRWLFGIKPKMIPNF